MRTIDVDWLISKLHYNDNKVHPYCYPCEWILKEIDNAPTATMYDYDLQKLNMFAQACKKAGVTNDDLKDFVTNVSFAYKVVEEDFENGVRVAIDMFFKWSEKDER